MKISRNDLCICGSKKKNKDCCKCYKIDDKEFNDLIFEAINLATTPSEKELIQGINKLESYLEYNLTNIGLKYNILSNLSMAYHNRGDDEKAVNLINRAQKEHEKLRTDIFFNIVKAISLSALGHTQQAVSLAKRTISRLDFDEDMFGLLFVELGKIFNQNNDFNDAADCYRKAVLYSQKKGDKLHEERATANLSLIKMLHSETPEIRKEGLYEIIENCNTKNETGDLEGLSTNYCNIALYYSIEKDFKGVLSYAKKDLYISRIVGNLRNVFISLRNLASYYIILKQFKKARHILNECAMIATELNDANLTLEVEYRQSSLIEITKEHINQKQAFDDKALCSCGSGKLFKDCCIVGDVEPIEKMPFKLDFNTHEEVKEIAKKYNHPNPLDFIFRKTYDTDTQLRLSWNQVKFHTGCYEISALPDMCSLYIQSIDEQLSIIDKEEGNTIHNALNCLLLSICAVESFINQVAYFFDSIKSQS